MKACPRFFQLLMLLVLTGSACRAVAAAADAPGDFAKDIQPLLQAYCLKCHTGEKGEGGRGSERVRGRAGDPEGAEALAGCARSIERADDAAGGEAAAGDGGAAADHRVRS